MKKNTDNTNKVAKQSPDLRGEMLDKLKKLYPPFFDNEGMLNQDELEQLVSDFSTPQTEKYEFNWAGKQQSKKKAFTVSRATLRSDEKRSVDFDKTENLIIEGDNLEVLKLLQKSYFGKIKCIYIDPPYNTGNDFIYPDDYSEDKQAYWEKSGIKQDGVKLDTNTDSSGRYHSNWLSMMYPRLLLARNLLKEDGVIFVSIDDNEVHNLRKLMDEVFGEENFIGTFIWKKKGTSTNVAGTHLSSLTEYVISYGKSDDSKLKQRITLKETRSYPYSDEDGSYRTSVIEKKSVGDYDRATMKFEILGNKPRKGKRWQIGEIKARELEAKNRFIIERGIVKLKVYDFEEEDTTSAQPNLLLEHGSTQRGQSETDSLMGGSFFDNPKPVVLIRHLFDMSSDSGDVVLDFFAGSGTTAHAVMDLNKEDGGNRKFILVQIPEATDEKSEAYKAGYKTISDICIERVKRAGKKLIDEANKLDVGFKVFKLATSHFPENTFAPDPDKTDEENKKALEAYIKKTTSQKGLFRDGVVDLVYEIALKDGFELTLKMDKVRGFDKNTVYKVYDSHREAFICVDDSLEDATIKQLEDHKDQRFICLHTSVNTTKKWNLQNILGSNLWLV